MSRISAQPYNWPHDASLNAGNTALVLIDMQRDFCSPGGYMEHQGYDISATRAIIPGLQKLLHACRTRGIRVYHTREGHRPDLSTLSTRELQRSRANPSGLGIGDRGPLGRLLIRGEEGHATIPELQPLEQSLHDSEISTSTYPLARTEPIIDKPGRGAFAHTDLELLLRLAGVRNLLVAGVTTDVCVHSTLREANDRGFDCLVVGDVCAAAEVRLHEAALESITCEGGIFGCVGLLKDVLSGIEGIGMACQ